MSGSNSLTMTPATDRSPADSIPPTGPRSLSVPIGLTGAYLFMLLVGVMVLRLPGATIRGNEMSFERAVFTSINAATLTGFQQAVALDDYTPRGQACVMALMCGGMLFVLVLGGMGLTRAVRLPYSDGQVIRATLVTSVFLIACGTAVLAERGRGLVSSATQALSAFSNSGLHLGRLPGAADWRTHASLLPLIFLGGLSIPVLMELGDSIFRRRRLSTHTLTVLSLSAALYLAGLILLFPWSGGVDGTTRVATASALSLDARTCGLSFVTIGSLPRATQWLLIVFMMIGAAPAGTAGGMKVTALFHLGRGTRRALARERGLRITGVAAVWIVSYLALCFLTLIGLLATLPELPADRLVFLSVSAISNVGLSHDPVSVTGGGLAILSGAMLLGRLAPLGMLWWVVMTTDDADVAV